MENTQVANVKNYFENEVVKDKFKEMLGKRATQFITSVVQIANSNELLRKADQNSLINAAIMAATLDLPINQNLGFAYIVPYKGAACFQMGYKGYIQLAQRSGQFKTISATPIYEGQIVSNNPLTGFEFDFSVQSSNIVGYAAFFELLNGFQKTLYMTTEQVTKHGKKFSQTFKKGFGLWADDFDGMAIKTVLKLLLSKYAPLSVEMQRAVISDQAVIRDSETLDVDYVDNRNDEMNIDVQNEEKERKRILEHIATIDNESDLDLFAKMCKGYDAEIEAKRKELNK